MRKMKTSSEILSGMIERGIVDPVLSPFDERLITLGFLGWFSTLWDSSRYRKEPKQRELWTSSQSRRFQTSHLPTEQCPDIRYPWAIEVARFAVPEGEIGFIKHIEQIVNDVDGNYYPTNVQYWGSPRFVVADVDDIRWYLTLSYFSGTFPPRFNVNAATVTPNALPGQPYPDLCEIDSLWYPAHNNVELNLIIPGGYCLRMFCITPICTTFTWEIGGRLSGWTQSTWSGEALNNARDL